MSTATFLQSGVALVAGPGGRMEVHVDAPMQTPRGIALIAHPQPLLGGSAVHKIPHLLARGARDAGWLAVRPNFRGVGGSEGVHDHGIGETDDLVALTGLLREEHPRLPLALIGFSFGAFVQSRVAQRLVQADAPAARVVLLGLPVGEVSGGSRHYETECVPNDTIVVHGERDEAAPLSALLEWARPISMPVVVVPGADHFFTGHLPLLRSVVVQHLR
jgi:uncharacterized protein